MDHLNHPFVAVFWLVFVLAVALYVEFRYDGKKPWRVSSVMIVTVGLSGWVSGFYLFCLTLVASILGTLIILLGRLFRVVPEVSTD